MRKKDATLVGSEFAKELRWLVAHHERVRKLIADQKASDYVADLGQIAASTFLTAFAEFEGFVSNLFVAYLNRDPSVFQAWRETSVRESVKKKFGDWTASRTSVAKEKHVNVEELRDLVDQERRNLTFKSADFMVTRAGEWLAAADRNRVTSLDEHDKRLIDTARSIRNYLAHGSDSAFDEMNDALGTVDAGPPNDGLGRSGQQVWDAGSLLKQPREDETVCSRYLARLEEIAKKMSP